jgi:hypothetical protein
MRSTLMPRRVTHTRALHLAEVRSLDKRPVASPQVGIDSFHESLHFLAARCAEKVDAPHLFIALLETPKLRRPSRPRADRLEERAARLEQPSIILLPPPPEIFPNLAILETGHRVALEYPRLAALLTNLPANPLRVLDRFVGARQQVGGVLERQRPQLIQPPQHLGP